MGVSSIVNSKRKTKKGHEMARRGLMGRLLRGEKEEIFCLFQGWMGEDLKGENNEKIQGKGNSGSMDEILRVGLGKTDPR